MKIWQIPAKTFLLGEYIALLGGPAWILTTKPCFSMELIASNQQCIGLHPESPAGLFWKNENHLDYGLKFHDPYCGKGGLGASSAQFLGAFYASSYLRSVAFDSKLLKEAYHFYTHQEGLKPSGYDLDAQSLESCVYIEQSNLQLQSFAWPFSDLSFLLVHTGQKLATHQHLQTMALPPSIDVLFPIVLRAKKAFLRQQSWDFIDAVSQYYECLNRMHLVHQNTVNLIETLKSNPSILAAKGCGAMGADIVVLLVPSPAKKAVQTDLQSRGLWVIASENELWTVR